MGEYKTSRVEKRREKMIVWDGMNFIRKGYYERMDKKENSKMTPLQFVFRVVQGALIGLGAVLPGISGGVLSVIFGIYKPIMELLSNPIPISRPMSEADSGGYRRSCRILGVANVLAFFLEKYPDPSVCLFVGLIVGMLPSLFREASEQGRKGSWISLIVCMIVIFAILIGPLDDLR